MARFLRRRSFWLVVAGLVIVGGAVGGRFAWRTWQFQSRWAAAEEATGRGAYGAALEDYRVCAALRPSDVDVHLAAERAARRSGEFAAAETYLDECRSLAPESRVVSLERLLLAAQRGDLDEQGQGLLLSLIQQDDPSTPLILEALTDLFRWDFQIPRALECANLWVARQPENSRPLVVRAWIWKRMRAFEKARDDYRRALELRPDDDTARQLLAELMLDKGMGTPEEVAQSLEDLHGRRPTDSAVSLDLARCRRQQGKTDGARQLLDELLQRSPEHAAALLERGKLEFDANEPAEAERWLERARQAAPHNRDVHYTLALCYRQLGKEDGAKAAMAEVQRIDADLKRLDRLIREVALGSQTDPNPRYEVAVLLLRNDRDEEALRWFDRALRVDPAHRPTHEALAAYYDRIGRKDLADEHRVAMTARHG